MKRCSQQTGGERGAVAIFAAIAAMALFIAIGIAVDGGRSVFAQQKANATAEEAARAGANAIKFEYEDNSSPTIDTSKAVGAAQQYLASADVTGEVDDVTNRGDEASVTVTTTVTQDNLFLSLVGLPTTTAHGAATARIARGITEEL